MATAPPERKLSARQFALHQKAEEERRRCQDWLIRIMRASRVKTRSKDDLRAEAMRDLKVSKNLIRLSLDLVD